jgi:ABC-type nitrate/sulfonate/bicarbonate transport system substrate-binding protein
MREPIYESRRDILRRGIGLGATALTGFTCAPTRRATAQTPRRTVNIVNTGSNSTFALQELIRQQGYLDEFGLDAKILNVGDGSKLMGALLNGGGDICLLSGFSQVFPAVERGGKLKIIAGAGLLPAHAVYSAKPEVHTLRDLEGRYVGTGAPGALLHQLMIAALRKNGVDYKKVTFVNVGSSADVFRAVAAKRVDAGPSLVDVFGEQAKYGVHAVAELWKELPEFTYQGSYASDQAIAQKRDLLVRTLAAHARLYRFISGPDSKDAFMRAYAAAIKQADPAQAEMQWSFAQQAGAYATGLVLSEERLHYMQELNVETGVQKSVLPFERVADMSLAQDAIKLLG